MRILVEDKLLIMLVSLQHYLLLLLMLQLQGDLNIETTDIKIGDILVDEELMRVKTSVSSNPITVFRGVLGTRAATHSNTSVVRRVHVRPVELRRNSIFVRLVTHLNILVLVVVTTLLLYLSVKMNNFLLRKNLSHSHLSIDGGVNVYTGMNDAGDFYIGNKKVSSATGQEEVFDAPIPTVTGEDISATGISVGFDVLTPLEASISRSLRVEGGPEGNIVSEFDGPVIFNGKVTLHLLKVLSLTLCSYKVTQLYLENIQFVLPLPHWRVTW